MPDASLPPAEVAAHAAFVRRLAGHLLRDEASADDAAQATLLRALERPPRRGPGLHAWFQTVLRNVARMGYRSGGRRVVREQVTARSGRVAAADDASARAEILQVVADAVASLEAKHREVVMLRHYEALPPREIAARLSIPVETVKSRLQRAHAELRHRLDERSRGNVEGWRGALAIAVGWPREPAMLGPIAGSAAVGTGTKVAAAAGVLLIGSGAWLVASSTLERVDSRSEGSLSSPTSQAGPGGAQRAPGALARAPTGANALRGAAAPPSGTSPPGPSEEPAGALVGDVRFAIDDAPVVGASVRAFQAITYAAVGAEATTTETGAYRIEGVPVGASVELLVRTRGSATVRAMVACPGALTRHAVRIAPGGILEGTVTDPDGRSLAGVWVSVLPGDGSLPWRPGRGASAWEAQGERDAALLDATQTDERGHYVIAHIPLEEPRVAVAEIGARRIAASMPIEFRAAGERLRRDLQVARPGSLRVVVSGVVPGTPVAVNLATDHLEVMLEPKDRQPDGSWLARDLSPGRWRASMFVPGSPFLGQHVEIESDLTREIELAVRGALAVEGTVVGPDGAPIQRAHVWWRGRPSSFVDADEAGRFRFDGLDSAPGTLVAIAPEPSAVAGRAILEGVRPGGGPIRVLIPEPATLRMRVEGPGSEGPLRVRIGTRLFTSSGPVHEREDDGSWALLVPSIDVPVQVVIQAWPSAPTVLETGPLTAGEVRDLGTVRLGSGRDLELVVTDAEGRACPQATVVVRAADTTEQTLVADASGRVRLHGQPLTPILVTAEVVGRPPHLFTLPATGPGPFSLAVSEGGRLEVHVLHADGSPGAGAVVLLVPAAPDPFDPSSDFAVVQLTADATGVASTKTQARAYRVRVEPGTGYGDPREDAIIVPSGQTTSTTVRLP